MRVGVKSIKGSIEVDKKKKIELLVPAEDFKKLNALQHQLSAPANDQFSAVCIVMSPFKKLFLEALLIVMSSTLILPVLL